MTLEEAIEKHEKKVNQVCSACEIGKVNSKFCTVCEDEQVTLLNFLKELMELRMSKLDGRR